MKKGLLKYAEDGGVADDSGKDKDDKKSEAKPESAGEMLGLELFEKAFRPAFGGEQTEMERLRGQLKAFKELLAYCGKGG